ncbi:MAG TPA: S41 family peptidase [Elusimicrobiales bacterium]|nr:S41 family peptidase [Elusimicrobiales bacterium]
MYRFLFFSLALLVCGCKKAPSDPAEITWVFDRHSYAEYDLQRMEAGLARSGPPVLRSFDPYALFFPPSWRPAASPAAPGNANAGLVLWRQGAEAVAVRVFPRSPAETAGLKAGDVVAFLNGQAVAGLPENAIGSALYGSTGGAFAVKGTKRGGGAFEVTLKRDYGGMPTVWGFVIPGSKTGYLRIVNFAGKAAVRMKAEMNDLLDGGANRVIIDLRGNYGGSIDQLSSALALFAPRAGAVFKAVSRHAGYTKTFFADAPGPYAGLKVLLLTDSGTLSRAEIFAAALREWGGASVVGGATAGNISATRGFRLKSGAALRLTVARLLTPAGLDLDGKGLVPDVPAPCPPDVENGALREFPAAPASADQALLKALGLP